MTVRHVKDPPADFRFDFKLIDRDTDDETVGNFALQTINVLGKY